MGIIAKGFGGVVAGILEGFELGGNAVEHGDAAFVFFGVGRQELLGIRGKEESGELGGGGLEANFGEFGCVVAAHEIEEVVLMEAEAGGVFLGKAPFAVAAVGFPVGDVLLIGTNAEFVEGTNNPVLGDVEREHAVDDVAEGFGEAGDFAGAGPAKRWREFKGDRRRWGERVR